VTTHIRTNLDLFPHFPPTKGSSGHRLFVLQSPLDTPDLHYLLVITPYVLCYGYLIFIMPYAQDLLSQAQDLLSQAQDLLS
jgi:hypothetical protein